VGGGGPPRPTGAGLAPLLARLHELPRQKRQDYHDERHAVARSVGKSRAGSGPPGRRGRDTGRGWRVEQHVGVGERLAVDPLKQRYPQHREDTGDDVEALDPLVIDKEQGEDRDVDGDEDQRKSI